MTELRVAWSVDPDGGVVAAADGVELLAWGGAELQPLWKIFGTARFMDVAVAERGVWTVDDAGALEVRRRLDGDLLGRTSTDVGGGVAVAISGATVAVAGRAGVSWLVDGHPSGRILVEGVVALCFSSDGRRLLAAEAQGSAFVVDIAAARVLGRVSIGGPPGPLLAVPEGPWLVGVGRRLRPVTWDGTGVGATADLSGVITGLALVGEDALLAVCLDGHRVELRGRADGAHYGGVVVGREVLAIRRSGTTALVLGLAHGDVQRVDLLTGQTTAGLPQPGRARVPWSIESTIDPVRLRALLVRGRIGQGPVAVQQTLDYAVRRPWWQTLLLWLGGSAGVLVLIVGVVLLVRSC
jgi:hypothetical protein